MCPVFSGQVIVFPEGILSDLLPEIPVSCSQDPDVNVLFTGTTHRHDTAVLYHPQQLGL